MVIIYRMVQRKLGVLLTLRVFEDMTLEIIFLLEWAEQGTSFKMSVDINMSAPLSALKQRRLPSARILHPTRETRNSVSRE